MVNIALNGRAPDCGSGGVWVRGPLFTKLMYHDVQGVTVSVTRQTNGLMFARMKLYGTDTRQ